MSDPNEDWDKSVYTQDYALVIYSYVGAVIMVVITTIFMMKFREHKHQHQISESDGDNQPVLETEKHKNIKAITRASITAVISYLISGLLFPIVLTKWIIIDQEHGNPLHQALIFIPTFFYLVNYLGLLFFVLLQRLNHVFPLKFIHRTSYIVPLTAMSMFVIIVIMFIIDPSCVDILNYMGGGIAAIYLILYIIIAVIFTLKITKVMRHRILANVSLGDIELRSAVSNVGDNDTKVSNDNKSESAIVNFDIVNDTVKYAFLVIICAASNCIMPLFQWIGTQFTKHETHQNTLVFYAMIMDTVCNTLCLCLLFGFMSPYYTCLCGSFHRCVLNCCINKVVKEFRKKNSNLTQEQYKSLIVN